MKSQLFMLLAFLLVLGGCSQEEWQNQEPAEDAKDLIVASFEGKGSRASILEKSLIWSEGDQIAVIGEDGVAYPFALLPAYAGSATGEFEGVMPENPQVVVFPYVSEEKAPTFTDNQLTLTLPNTITDINQCNLPMWSAWNGKDIYFKHLVGLLAINVNDIPVGYHTLKVTASNIIAGEFKAIDLTLNEVTLVKANADEANKVLTVKFEPAAENNNDRLVYIPLPVGTYANIKVSLSNGSSSNELELKTWTNKVVQRAKIYSASLAYVVVEATKSEEVTTALENAFKTDEGTEIVTAPEESKQVEVVGQITATEKPIVIPAAEEGKTSDISMNFSNAPITTAETPLVIEQNWTKEAVSQESNNNLTISMPAEEEIGYVEIKTPTTSTALNGGAYTRLTATTATNTLIIGEGTVIEHLIIGGGNIRIQKGGQITGSITNNTDSTIEIILEKDATLDDSVVLDGNFITLDAVEYDFRQAIAKGGKIVMAGDMKTNKTFEITLPTIIDLNGYNIHVSEGYAFNVLQDGELTLMDVNNTASVEYNINSDGGSVNIQGGIYRGTLSATEDANISITGGQFSEDPSRFVAEGYVATRNTNNTYYTVHKAVIIENAQFSAALMNVPQLQGKIKLNAQNYAVITEADAATVTDISINGIEGGIATIDQLDKFPNLKSFSCTNCGVENIVIPEKNVLESLSLGDNLLTTIDLQNAANLTSLAIRNNNLSTLDLSKQTSLSTLFCYGNQLEALDLSNNTAIVNLLCGAQKDSQTLILTLPEELKNKWHQDWMGYGENMNVDLEGEVIIRNAQFSAALMNVPQLQGKIKLNVQGYAIIAEEDAEAVTEINLENGEYTIPSLSGIEHFKNLIILNIPHAGIQECVLSENTKLQYVYLFENALTSLDFSNQPELLTLQCGHNKGLAYLNIENCEKITEIGFESTALTSISIPNWMNLTSLNYSNTDEQISFDLSQFECLDSFYAVGKGLTSLNFSDECKQTLTKINVENNNLTSFNFSEYPELQAFRCNGNYIKSLDITNSKLTDLSTMLGCGNQQNNKLLVLKLTEAQKATCTSEWKNENPNVVFFDEAATEGSGSLDDFVSGGEF